MARCRSGRQSGDYRQCRRIRASRATTLRGTSASIAVSASTTCRVRSTIRPPASDQTTASAGSAPKGKQERPDGARRGFSARSEAGYPRHPVPTAPRRSALSFSRALLTRFVTSEMPPVPRVLIAQSDDGLRHLAAGHWSAVAAQLVLDGPCQLTPLANRTSRGRDGILSVKIVLIAECAQHQVNRPYVVPDLRQGRGCARPH